MCPAYFFLMIFGDKCNERSMYLVEVLREELGGFTGQDSVVNELLVVLIFSPFPGS